MQGLDVSPHLSSNLCEPYETVRPSEDILSLVADQATRQTVSAIFFFLVVLLLVYAPSFSGIWIYDDEPNILSNDNIHLTQVNLASLKKTFFLKFQDVHTAERIKRPLAYLSFALNWYVGQDQVFGYHLVNFIIHFTTTVFLYLFIKNSLMLPIVNSRYRNRAHLAAG